MKKGIRENCWTGAHKEWLHNFLLEVSCCACLFLLPTRWWAPLCLAPFLFQSTPTSSRHPPPPSSFMLLPLTFTAPSPFPSPCTLLTISPHPTLHSFSMPPSFPTWPLSHTPSYHTLHIPSSSPSLTRIHKDTRRLKESRRSIHSSLKVDYSADFLPIDKYI